MNRIKLIVVMVLWGSIGLFTRYIDLSPIQLAYSRAVLGGIVVLAMNGKRNWTQSNFCKKSVLLYILSGAMIGVAWVALFYGYAHTTIASAVIIYNMCPVYVMLAAPIVLKEKRNGIQTLVIILSLIGLILIVGAPSLTKDDFMGKIMSCISGLLYAIIVLINRKIKVKLNSNIATAIQMISASMILLPFVVKSGFIPSIEDLSRQAFIMTLFLGIVHTGIAYNLYFSTYHQMKSIEIVMYSYLEPFFGLVFSVVFLHEHLTIVQMIGGLLIIGSTFVGENIQSKRLGLLKE